MVCLEGLLGERKPLLSNNNMAARLRFAAKLNKQQTMSSDETKVEMFGIVPRVMKTKQQIITNISYQLVSRVVDE